VLGDDLRLPALRPGPPQSRRLRPFDPLPPATDGFIAGFARDGADSYWIRDLLPKPSGFADRVPVADDCVSHSGECTLVDTREVPFKRVAQPPADQVTVQI
jgi:hypothetical protein